MRHTLGIVALIGAMTVIPTAQATEALDGAYTCYVAWDSDTVREDFGGDDRWIDMTAQITFDQCKFKRSARRFVNPLYYTVSYNIEGRSIGCGFPNEFERVDYRVFVWDGGGRNWDRSGSLGCSEDTTAEEIHSMASAPALRYCSGQPPKWKVNFETIVRFEHNDHATARGTLWDYVGPVGSTC